ncbi:GNAT family N-acetyltransferase [Micrococcoides hystricis]|uniref:GNAT family N-acetyltransferase n=1 Tax=Micrococcoides hystricis TaxID=1572761 RepID=A0ABV6PAU0_9MICC
MLQLREVTAADLDVFFTFQQDPDATRMAAFAANNPSDRAVFDHYWQALLNDERVTARTMDLDGRPIGSVAALPNSGDAGFELVFWTDKEYWHKGLTSQAVQQFVAEFDKRPLYARAVVDNVGSLKILESAGFEKVGCEPGFSNVRQEVVDERILKLS